MRRFGLPAPMTRLANDLAKKADRAAAWHEATRLAGFTAPEANEIFGEAERLPAAILALLEPMSVDAAQAAFLARFSTLDREWQAVQSSRTQE